MAEKSAPVILRTTPHPIAWLIRGVCGLSPGAITPAKFLDHVDYLYRALPQGRHAINLCGNRYLFTVSLCAAALRGHTNLLPPNKNPATQLSLADRFDQTYILHDGVALQPDIPVFDVNSVDFSNAREISTPPQIALDHLAAISFTSGSTGQSKPNLKSWSNLLQGAGINAGYMLPDGDAPQFMIATVPGQHMWGLETSVALALTDNLCVADSRPLYPKDIQTQLALMNGSRVLVSTPVHLRALVMSGLVFPQVERVLCATAPLDKDLAISVEKIFSGQLIEIYGCSEVGSMAWRRTSVDDLWRRFSDFHFTQTDGQTVVSAGHVPDVITLQDMIEEQQEGLFALKGRHSDMIEIAGKRGSLKELNEVLSRLDGVLDGVVLLPPQDRAVPRLVAIVVLQPGAEGVDVAAHFRKHFDSAFIPRQVLKADSLPREENGKLTADKILALYNQLQGGSG